MMPETGKSEPPLFSISLLKLTLMSICTAGLYELYWFYRTWKAIKAREASGIWPFWRACFAFFFCYQCFAKIRAQGKSIGVAGKLPAGALAVGWIATTMTWKLPDPYWWISSLTFCFLLPAQAYANRINAAKEYSPDARLGAWEWVVAIAGGLFMVLALIGTFVPVR